MFEGTNACLQSLRDFCPRQGADARVMELEGLCQQMEREIEHGRTRVLELEAAVDVVDHRTRPAICSALGNLGSMRAIPILLELLEFGTPGTSAAAQAALVRLTGRRDVAADSRLWIEELGLDDAR